MTNLEATARRMQEAGVFLGGPLAKFTDAGRAQLIELLRHGLEPGSKVLDVGCGCLRGGLWMIRLLDRGGYCGIEPNTQMLEAGIRYFIGDELMEQKAPQFSDNDQFDFTVFGETFDFVIARSIWTHASPSQIDQMLASFNAVRRPGAVFLSSVKLARAWQSSYDGSDWVGRSHKSSARGTVLYSRRWLQERAARSGCRLVVGDKVLGQTWVIVRSEQD